MKYKKTNIFFKKINLNLGNLSENLYLDIIQQYKD